MADKKVIKEQRAALVTSKKRPLKWQLLHCWSRGEIIEPNIKGQWHLALPGAGASWRAEPQVVLTSEAVVASSWLGYSATVPATANNSSKTVKCRN